MRDYLRVEGGSGTLPVFTSSVPRVSVGTCLRTLRYLHAFQLLYLIKRRLPHGLPKRPHCPARLREMARPIFFPEWQPMTSRHAIETGKFRFLHLDSPESGAIPWSSAFYSQLWLYNLNYFDFLNLSFDRPDDPPLLRKAVKLALDWCEHNPTGQEVGWQPYPTSLRIVNWLKFLHQNTARMGGTVESQSIDGMIASLHQQVLSLEQRLEFGLMNNHVLKNAKALLFASALLATPDAPRWQAKGKKLLLCEVGRQVLPDGGHFERSPMYHAQVLEDLLDLRLLSISSDVDVALPSWESKLDAMEEFLCQMVHPDGSIVLFNDSTLGASREAAELSAYRGTRKDDTTPKSGLQVYVFEQSGYGTIRDHYTGDALFFDCGPVGPDCQPGHGHSDLLSFELSLEGQRVVVDTGVSTYEKGKVRQYERSTSAHNTLRIDGIEQAEMWGSFRVGRRPPVGCLTAGAVAGFHFVRGEHFAYRHLGVVHTRTIVHAPGDCWVIADWLQGTGSHQIESFIHFHPSVRVAPCPDACAAHDRPTNWRIRVGDTCYVLISQGWNFCLTEAWYSPEFGLRQKQSVLYCERQADLPTGMLYSIVPGGQIVPRVSYIEREEAVEIDGTAISLRSPSARSR